MLRALLLNFSSVIPPRVLRTPTGGGSNRPSPRAKPRCAISFLGRRPCQTMFCRLFLHPSAFSFRKFWTLLPKDNCTKPTTASSCSSVDRFCPLPPDSQLRTGRVACLMNNDPVRIYVPYSCALGSCRLAIRRLPATSALCPTCACTSGSTGGLLGTLVPEVNSQLPDVPSTETFAADG